MNDLQEEFVIWLVEAGNRADAVILIQEETGLDHAASAEHLDALTKQHGVRSSRQGMWAAAIALIALTLGSFAAFS